MELNMETDITFKAGDVCLDCQQLGIEKRLRYFKINLNGDTLLKCESNECMYPYNDEMDCSTDNDDDEERVEKKEDVESLKFIDDFIQQYTNETLQQESHNNSPNSGENVATQFDISFLDNFNENLCKTEISQDSHDVFDSKSNVEIIDSEFLTIPNNSEEIYPSAVAVKEDIKTFSNNLQSLPILVSFDYENDQQISSGISLKDYKPKIDIQSIETIDIKTPLYNILPTCSKNLTTSTKISSKSSSEIKEIKKSSLNCSKVSKSETKRISNLSLELPKSQELSLINSTKTSDISLKDQRENPELAETIEENPKKISSDIPKANIMKGRDFLKKLAIVDEKMSKQNFKSSRKKKKITHKEENIIKEEKPPTLPALSGDMDYSLEKIAQMLNAKKQNNNK